MFDPNTRLRAIVERALDFLSATEFRARRERERLHDLAPVPSPAAPCPPIHSIEDGWFALFCVERHIDRRTLDLHTRHHLRAQWRNLYRR